MFYHLVKHLNDDTEMAGLSNTGDITRIVLETNYTYYIGGESTHLISLQFPGITPSVNATGRRCSKNN